MISVAITNAPSSVVVGSNTIFTAVVRNDSAGAGVTWSVTCANTACGSVAPTSTKGDSSSTTYTAPATVPTGNKVTITATSSADTTKSAFVSVMITTSSEISVSISDSPTSLAAGAAATLTANVRGDDTAAGVTWGVKCGNSACGSFNPTTSTGNSATTIYTAPSAVPSGNTVTVTATSIADSTKSASATITITASGPPVLADGNYVYRASGEDGNGPYFVAGVFTVTNGVIKAGEQDYVDRAQGTENTIVPANSSLTTASDGNFQLVIATGNSDLGVEGTETFRGTMVSGTRALITEFDTFAAAGGTLDLQTSTGAPSGGYAFNVGGVDGSANGNPLFIGGVISISGTSIVVANSEFDYFDGGAVGQNQNFGSGNVTTPDSLGRIIVTLTPNQASGDPQFSLIGYVVGSNEIQLVESSTDALGGTLGGSALGQGSNAGTFSASKIGGSTYVFVAVGADNTSGIATFGGRFALSSAGTVSGELAYNDVASEQTLQINGGNWEVDSLGRVGLSNITVTGSNIGNGPFAFQLYLDGNGNALELGTDTIQGSTGPSYVQTSTQQVSRGKYAIGAEGFGNTANLPVWSAVGTATLDSSLNWTGFTDYNVFGTPTSDVALSGTTNTTEALFSVTGLNAVSPVSSTPEFHYYQVDSTTVLAIELDSNQLGVFELESISQ
ncbi:MAG: hypothetical protein WBR26_04115 [Candidatus Acidiferrum sp.]